MTDTTDLDTDEDPSDPAAVPNRRRDLRSFLLTLVLLLLLAACTGMIWVAMRRTAETVRPIGTAATR
jgi:hypothetical protein